MAFRLWLHEPAGSVNCPPGYPNCINSGAQDPGKTPMCYDPRQFKDFNELLAYATTRGEQLRQVTTAAEAEAMCSVQGGGAMPPGSCANPPCGAVPTVPTIPTVPGGTGGTGGGGSGATGGNCSMWTPGRNADGTSNSNCKPGTGAAGGAGAAGGTGAVGTIAAGFNWLWILVIVTVFLIWRK